MKRVLSKINWTEKKWNKFAASMAELRKVLMAESLVSVGTDVEDFLADMKVIFLMVERKIVWAFAFDDAVRLQYYNKRLNRYYTDLRNEFDQLYNIEDIQKDKLQYFKKRWA